MPIVREDIHGPWIDLGEDSFGGSALRPVCPTALRLGDCVDTYHFGGSTLHGISKVPGARGSYLECWISAPASRELYEKRALAFMSEIDFDFAWSVYQRDLAVFHRGNPKYEPEAPFQRMAELKNRRAKYVASVGYTFGILAIQDELAQEGALHLGRIASGWEARTLACASEAPSREISRAAKLRV